MTYRSNDFVVIATTAATSGIAFQRAPDHQPPVWPDPARPQQFHLDVMVDDVTAAEPEVLRLGARRLAGDHVYADPAGHPFCLIPRPSWAPPVHAADGDAADRPTNPAGLRSQQPVLALQPGRMPAWQAQPGRSTPQR